MEHEKSTITFSEIYVADLESFIRSDDYQKMEEVPISPQRAAAQAKNPLAKATDVALLLAFQQNKMIGYLGAMGDMLHLKEGKQRVGNLTCWWIHPSQRGKGVGVQLMQKMIAAWAGKVFLTDYVPGTKAAYIKMNLFDLIETAPAWRGFLRLSLTTLLPPKGGVFNRLKPIWTLLDVLLYPMLALRLRCIKTPSLNDVVTELPTDCFSSLQIKKQQLTVRDPDYWNWVATSWWILPHQNNTFDASRYVFSSTAKTFNICFLTCLDEHQKPWAYILVALRDGHLKVIQSFATDLNLQPALGQIQAAAKHWGCNSVTIYCPDILEVMTNRNMSVFFYHKKLDRSYFVSKTLAEGNILNFNPNDGDLIFT